MTKGSEPFYAKGFTIVELLIVIVVIGILAAIVIVAYSGVQNKGYDTSVQANLRNTSAKIMEFQTNSQAGSYPTASQTDLQSLISVSKNAYKVGTSGSASYCRSDTDYSLYGRSVSGNTYVYSSKNGLITVASTGNLNSECALGGIATTDSGYQSLWLMNSTTATPPGWQAWIQ